MKTVLVRYTTRDDKADENETLIRAVFDELRSRVPAGLRYDAFKFAGSSGFVHLATIDTPDGSNPLVALDAFKRFANALGERCTEDPVAIELIRVDGYESTEPQRVT
jgi:hypothetical protein